MLRDMCTRPFRLFWLTMSMEKRTRKRGNSAFSFIVHFYIFFSGDSERKWKTYLKIVLLSSSNLSHAREMSVFRFMCRRETCKNTKKMIYVQRVNSLLNQRNAKTYLGAFLCYSHWKWDETHPCCLNITRFKVTYNLRKIAVKPRFDSIFHVFCYFEPFGQDGLT